MKIFLKIFELNRRSVFNNKVKVKTSRLIIGEKWILDNGYSWL